jgi:methoxymalonate biosynthesis protein
VSQVPAARIVKCVVWDIDNTLLGGVYLESGGELPGVDPVVGAALAEFAGRGILHAIASRNPPEVATYVARVTGRQFAAVECGWGRKSDAVARIAAGLGIGTDSLAFVDDDPYERAEVSAALPEVLVLAPQEVTEAAMSPEFGVTAVTGEARRRGEMYTARRSRQDAERAFGGSRQSFLTSVGTQVTIAAAEPADVPRLHELTARTRQFNSAGQAVPEAEFAALIEARQESGTGRRGEAEPDSVVTVRLRDDFGDDGIVGACVVTHGTDGSWTVRLLAMSCRAMGRGVIGALLAWLTRQAARQDATGVAVPCVLTERNVPLRLALAAAGFRAAGSPAAGPPAAGRTEFRRTVAAALPGLPSWVSAPGEPGRPAGGGPGHGGDRVAAIEDELREILAGLSGRAELAAIPADAALFGDGVALDSLTGTLLLREVHRRYGADVAAVDLNLDALATLGTLASFIAGWGD